MKDAIPALGPFLRLISFIVRLVPFFGNSFQSNPFREKTMSLLEEKDEWERSDLAHLYIVYL